MSSSSDVSGSERSITLKHFSTRHNLKKQSLPYDPQYEVAFTGDDDPRSPRCLPAWRKWVIIAVVSTTSLCVACASSLYTGTIAQVEHKFGTSRTITALGLSMFVVGLGLGPMILAPLSEVCREKSIYSWLSLLIPPTVLRSSACLCDINIDVCHLDRPMCGGQQHPNACHCSLL